MKKLAVIAAAAMLVFSFVGQAAAYFDDELSITRVVYHRSGTFEVGTDLMVNAEDLRLNPSNYQDYITGGGMAAWNIGMFPGADYSDLYVAYFAKYQTGADAYISGPDTGLTTGNRKIGGFNTGATAITGLYQTGLEQTVTFEQANENSYWKNMDKAGLSIGSMAALLTTYLANESLGTLLTDGFVDQYLYFWDTANSVGSGLQIATIRTMADGSTIINPNPVPIPGSVLLLASGLLGVFGFRRKRA